MPAAAMTSTVSGVAGSPGGPRPPERTVTSASRAFSSARRKAAAMGDRHRFAEHTTRICTAATLRGPTGSRSVVESRLSGLGQTATQ
jgi:hypothetical protein